MNRKKKNQRAMNLSNMQLNSLKHNGRVDSATFIQVECYNLTVYDGNSQSFLIVIMNFLLTLYAFGKFN